MAGKPGSRMPRGTIFGVGINNADYYLGPASDRCWVYERWREMLRRCYSQREQLRNPTYGGCKVDKSWHLFMNFKQWVDKQNYESSFELDKDLLAPSASSGKVYSEARCLFVPSNINKLFNIRQRRPTRDAGLPIGVHISRGKFKSLLQSQGKSFNGRRRATILEAGLDYVGLKQQAVDHACDMYPGFADVVRRKWSFVRPYLIEQAHKRSALFECSVEGEVKGARC